MRWVQPGQRGSQPAGKFSEEAVMVSSYLVCDLCGRFGPPASIFSQDGLRLCYQCWHEARQGNELAASDEPAPASGEEAQPAAGTDTAGGNRVP
ncbi:MAG: hypothetical protein U1F70_01845 [Candidatus Competibacteraceae bacterium]